MFVQHIQKILIIIILLTLYSAYPQNSSISKPHSLHLAINSNIINNEYFLYTGIDEFSDRLETRVPVLAEPSVLINSERPLADGTDWKKYSDVNYLRLSSMVGIMASVNTVAYLYQRKVWYTKETTGFHSLGFIHDWNKYQQMDKFGHFTDAYFTSDLTSKIYRWSGFSGETSVWLGALTGWMWMLEIEVSDAFMADWGFSWGDMLANTVGSGFFVLQQFNYDALGGIHPKVSWHKSEAWKEMRYNSDPQALIEDYEGMTFWLAVNPHHYFPESWKNSYPQWLAPLGIAFGVSAKDVASFPWAGYKEYFIGLDIDLRKLPVGDDWPVFKFIKSEVNFLRLPLPTIRFSSHGTWVGFYF
jgi:hypothetical protein